ncbi:MAG: energy transducer TonB [Prolixibacteraceae bacterium]|nr:energy transducer TonB [Prolixibacteraceae bacterium]
MRYNLELATILIVLQLLSVRANSQEIIKTLFGQYKEKYAASIDNKEVKDGPYSVFHFNKLVIQGHYSNNQKSGLWTIYDAKEDTEFVYNYDLNLFELWNCQDQIQDCSGKKRSAYCVDGFQILGGRITEYVRYPESAMMDGKQGSSIVTVVIDRNGQFCDLNLSKSSGHSVLDKEAVRTVQIICAKSIWFPAVDNNDIPIDDKLQIKVNFVLK